jgi:23S rRNA (uracil1939-C5)-methyltransferase
MRNKIINHVEVERIASEGKCIAHVDGKAVFIEGVVPGDVIDLKVTRKKKSFLEGKAIAFHKKSEKRVEPFCSHFSLCGGCKWQHLDYQFQIEAKRQQVIDNFERIGKFNFPEVNPIIASEETKFYRNKLEYTFSNKRWLSTEEIADSDEINRNGVGFHIPRHFDKIVDIEKCYLQKEPTNEIRNELRSFAIHKNLTFYDIKENTGLLRNLVIRTSSTGQLMVIVQFGEDKPDDVHLVMNHIKVSFPSIDALYYVVNLKKNETFHDLVLVLFYGRHFIEERINNLEFKLGPKSFFQTNTLQTQKLYSKTLEMAQLTGEEIVFDLYCGTGTITNFVAQKAKKAVGIETIKEAIDDARENAQNNNISNSEFVVGDIKDILSDDFILKYGQPDVVITDPPRAGMHQDVITTMLKMNPEKIVYVSCNPATQARDLAFLVSDYEILEIQPFDMFPHTHHLENIVSLKKRK